MSSSSNWGAPGAGDYLWLCLLGALWGASFLFIKLAVETIPAVPMTAIRLVIAAAFMFALARFMGERLPKPGRVWLFIGLAAVFGNALPFTLIGWGEERIDSGLAAILIAPMPLIAVVLAHIFTKDEKLNARKLAGLTLGIVGLVVMIGPEKLTQLGDDTVRQLAVVGAAGCYAINVVANRGLSTGTPLGNIAAVQILAAVLMLPVCMADTGSWSFSASTVSILSLVVLAIVQTALANLMMLEVVRRQGASFAAQVNLLVPGFGLLWGVMFLSEVPHRSAVFALLLVLLGVAIARGGLKPPQRPG